MNESSLASKSRADGPTIADRLYDNPTGFSFFQAVRLLEKIYPDRKPVASTSAPSQEAVHFRALTSLSFPPSEIYDLQKMTAESPAEMTVTFFGLTGPSGILPRHYTDLLLRLYREKKGPERTALRDWFDLFNHRMISLFYRTWAKYRFYLGIESNKERATTPDVFTLGMYSLIGLGTPNLRSRMRVSFWEPFADQERALGRLEDQTLLFYAGVLSRRQRTAAGLEGMLTDFLSVPVEVRQFQGQWLQLDVDNQSAMGNLGLNNTLGGSSVAGERVWDVQGKIRICLGPMPFRTFTEFIPDRSLAIERKSLFVLLHLIRFFVGSELTFDVQLILEAEDIPECHLLDEEPGSMLGWNTWLRSQEGTDPSEDAVFAGEEFVWINDEHRPVMGV